MDAFRLLVEKYKDVSLSLIFSIVKDEAVAEDILQEAFIKVFHKIDTFKFKANFSTWLYRIMVNLSYNELKRTKINQNVNDLAQLPENLISKEELLKVENQKKYIHLALKKINADEALVLQLFYLSEMSINEVMKITGFSKAKVKVSLHRGRNNLNFQLKRLLGNELKHLL